MSATRDSSQKVTFVYTNLFQLFKKEQQELNEMQKPENQVAPLTVAAPLAAPAAKLETPPAAPVSAAPMGLTRGAILKSEDIREKKIQVSAYTPVELMGKRTIPKPAILTKPQHEQNQAVQSLRKNLGNLQDLHSRLKFMLTELDELVKTKK